MSFLLTLGMIVIPPQAIINNALHYRKRARDWDECRSPTKRRLVDKSEISIPTGPKCILADCGAQGDSFFVDNYEDGVVVCTVCGTIQQTPVFQELTPFYWSILRTGQFYTGNYNPLNATSSYRHKFHWNEDDKLRRMVAPPVPKFNKDIIFAMMRSLLVDAFGSMENVDYSQVDFKKWVQKSCGEIDSQYGIELYSRKWGENWIHLVYEFTRGKVRPPIQTAEECLQFFEYFQQFQYAWPMCSHLLSGSKKGSNRRQLPQYRWIFRQLLITFCPHEFEKWRNWVHILSPKKETELDMFWRRVCYVNGWFYVPTFEFIKPQEEQHGPTFTNGSFHGRSLSIRSVSDEGCCLSKVDDHSGSSSLQRSCNDDELRRL